MYYLNPIFTETTTCQDCYKCLRECSVKAIQIERACARIMPEDCTLCGHCVSVCPVGAKKVRDDTSRFAALKQSGRTLIALLAPSWVCEYPELSQEEMIHKLKCLGFEQVIEVSLGAHEANLAYTSYMHQQQQQKLFISSACPTIVRYLHLYDPKLAAYLLPVASPLELTAEKTKAYFGTKSVCVFFGPCIAKKSESDRNRDLIDIALSYRDLDRLFEEDGLVIQKESLRSERAEAQEKSREEAFVYEDIRGEEPAAKAHLYPIDGGMTAGIKRIMGKDAVHTMVFSGMDHVRQALEGINPEDLDQPLFLELMACEGGCVNGPQTRLSKGTITKRLTVLKNQTRGFPNFMIPLVSKLPKESPEVNYVCRPDSFNPAGEIKDNFDEAVNEDAGRKKNSGLSFNEEQIRQSLARIGKHDAQDELNCSACGYDSCRDFAKACLQGKAETTMCVSWMRKLVEKKANALLATMPSGVVILNRDLKIIESNRNFARMLGEETEELFNVCPGLSGADARKILPRIEMFYQVFEHPEHNFEEDLDANGRILHTHIFSIEPGQVAGALFQDITIPTVQRDRVVQQAQEVIEKNLSVVQQIAWLLGENAAESEGILNSIIQSFSSGGTTKSSWPRTPERGV